MPDWSKVLKEIWNALAAVAREANAREQAANLEVELKKLVDSNTRQIRRMVQGFQDLVTQLDFS